MGRNQQLHMYQQAIAAELADKYGALPGAPLAPCYELDMWFWRNTERANIADATNMQKATEDALQGILLANDRDVVRVGSRVVAQGTDVAGAVVFRIRWGVARNSSDHVSEIPTALLAEMTVASTAPKVSDNSWPPRTS